MIKLYRGDVIEVAAPAGVDKFGTMRYKPRPVIVLQNVNRDSNIISVYCTTQNNGDDKHNIFVEKDSEHGKKMGLSADTYIRPSTILNLPIESFKRFLGKCPLMDDINKIMDKIQTGR